MKKGDNVAVKPLHGHCSPQDSNRSTRKAPRTRPVDSSLAFHVFPSRLAQDSNPRLHIYFRATLHIPSPFRSNYRTRRVRAASALHPSNQLFTRSLVPRFLLFFIVLDYILFLTYTRSLRPSTPRESNTSDPVPSFLLAQLPSLDVRTPSLQDRHSSSCPSQFGFATNGLENFVPDSPRHEEVYFYQTLTFKSRILPSFYY